MILGSRVNALDIGSKVIFEALVTEIHMHMFEPVMEGSGSAVAFTESRGE